MYLTVEYCGYPLQQNKSLRVASFIHSFIEFTCKVECRYAVRPRCYGNAGQIEANRGQFFQNVDARPPIQCRAHGCCNTKQKQNENTSSAGDKFGPDPMIQSSPLLRASAGCQSKRPREEMHVGGGYFDQPIDRANGGESQWGADGRGSTSRRHCLAPIHLSRTRVSSQNSRVPVAPCPSVSR